MQNSEHLDKSRPSVTLYFQEMIERHRTAMVFEDGVPVALATFFILNSVDQIGQFYHRSIWETPLDFPEGKVIYIDKLLTIRRWLPSMRRALEKALLDDYPQLEVSAWHQPTMLDDRLVVKPIRRALDESKV